MQCVDEQCLKVTEYTDDEYTILAVSHGTIIGKIAHLTVAPRRNCFVKADDGRLGYLPTDKTITETIATGTVTFRKYSYALHCLAAREKRSNEKPVKFDTIIARGDKIIVITGTKPAVEDMKRIKLGKTYDFQGHEEYHACNHYRGET